MEILNRSELVRSMQHAEAEHKYKYNYLYKWDYFNTL